MAAQRIRHILFTVFLLGCLLALGAGAAQAANTWAYVTSANDSGAGSMREQAQTADGLMFNLPNGTTITLATPLDFGATSFDFNNTTAGGTLTLAGAALQGSGTLAFTTNSNHFNFTNTLNFTGGLRVAGGSYANITLADYTGGRILLGTDWNNEYHGVFSGKLNIQNQSGGASFQGGGLAAHNSWGPAKMFILDGSLIAGNTLSIQGEEAHGGGIYVLQEISSLAGAVSNNKALVTYGGTQSGTASGGGVYASTITGLPGTVDGNMASATATGSGSAYASGGGVYAATITAAGGNVTGNLASATAQGAGSANAWGGGVFARNITAANANISGNTASAAALQGQASIGLGGRPSGAGVHRPRRRHRPVIERAGIPHQHKRGQQHRARHYPCGRGRHPLRRRRRVDRDGL